MKQIFLYSCCAAGIVLCLLGTAPAPSQGLVSTFTIVPPIFSPDGDGKWETTTIKVGVTVDSTLVSLAVLADDSATVVKNIAQSIFQNSGTNVEYTWNGTNSVALPVGHGMYIVRVHAQKGAQEETRLLSVWVDTVAPELVIQQIVPAVYTPEVITQPQSVQVVFDISNSTAPGGLPAGDELTWKIYMPARNGKTLALDTDTLRFFPPFAGDGRYTARWKAANPSVMTAEGLYSLWLQIGDNVGHSDSTRAYVEVNLNPPDIIVTSPPSGDYAVIPDSLHGKIYDRHGIDLSSLGVRYSAASPSLPLYSLRYDRADTLLFSIPLADSIVEERKYTLYIDAADLYEHKKSQAFDITLDNTNPPAPVLDPLPGSTHASEIYLTGTFGGDLEWIRFYRNGALIDSVFSALVKSINQRVPLVKGKNIFTATTVDGAKNESPHSNAVSTFFLDQTGLYIPAPFVPNDEFRVNLDREAYRLTVRIFDMEGELVVSLRDLTQKQKYLLPWNGKNGGGEDVKKGPLVAVAEVTYEDGEKVIYREIFLFDPQF